MPPDARLGGVPALQALHEPSRPVHLVPRPVVQHDAPRGWTARLRGQVAPASGAVLILAGFGAAFFYLLSFRDAEIPQPIEKAVEVEIKVEGPKGESKAGSGAGQAQAPPSPQAPQPSQADTVRQALAPPVAPDPAPPAPPRLQPPPPTPASTPHLAPPPKPVPPAASEAAPRPPTLVAPPPDPTRAATQEHADKPANLAPDKDKQDTALREAQAAETPRALATSDDRASFAIPLPAPASPKPAEKPAPPIPAKGPSAADHLAAALAMDPAAMPSSFRSVLAGNGSQADAAYKGLVFGRFNRHPEIGERAREQHLKGQVVVAFTIDDAGQIAEIGVARSSGNAALDALAVELIRAAAPFPPPPPGAQRSFTPALGFGD